MSEIPKLVLDPRNDEDLRTQMLRRTLAASGGQLTDTSRGSVLAALAEGQVFAIAELLYFLNMLPEATALEVFRLAGIQRQPGTKATGTLSFLLVTTLPEAFTVPQGYVVSQGPLSYELTETLFIPAGYLEASAKVRAVTEGTGSNLPAYGFNQTNTGLTYCRVIYNTEAITGGSDLETLEALVQRSQVAIRTRDTLVSLSDYETEAVSLLGPGVAKAVPFLSANRTTEAPAQVHVFLVTDDLQKPSTATCAYVQEALQSKSFVASRVWVSPANLLPLTIDLSVSVDQLGLGLAQQILKDYQDYLHPRNLGIGADVSVKRLEHLAFLVPGVSEVMTCQVDREPLRKPMPNHWTLPVLDSLVVTETDPLGRTQVYYLGPASEDRD